MDRLPGITQSKASYREGNAIVQYDPAQVAADEIANAITAETYYKAGQPVPGGEITGGASATATAATAVIRVEGMTDERTASLVTQAIGSAGPAITDVSLDTAESTLTVVYDPDEISAETMVDAINRGTEHQASLISTTSAGGGGGIDYTPYVVLGIVGLFVAALAWPAVFWGRRQLAHATAPSRARRRRAGRDRRRG